MFIRQVGRGFGRRRQRDDGVPHGGTKGLSSTWPEMVAVAGPPLVPVRITNRD
jgi:hypothetical protein